MNRDLLYAGAVALLAAPLPACVFTWVAWVRSPKNRLALIVLVVLTTSYLLLVLGLAVRNVVGPDYSLRRSLTIETNTWVTLATLPLSVLRGQPQRGPLLIFGVLLALAWLYLGVVSVAV